MGYLEIGIAMVDKKLRGQGLAYEALSKFIDFCFNDLVMHRINARIISGNLASLSLFNRLGFKQEG